MLELGIAGEEGQMGGLGLGEERNREVGVRVMGARKGRGWGLREMVERLGGGFDESVLSKLERGRLGFGVARLVRIAEVLGVSVDWLLFGDKERKGGSDVGNDEGAK